MEPLELVAVVAVVTIISTSVVKLANAFFNRKRPADDSGQLQRLEQRLERIEQAIDTMSVEVERISEGQRFTTKLLAERSKETA